MTKGYCTVCGTVIYKELRWRLKRVGPTSRFTQVIEEKYVAMAERVQYVVFLATERGPEICHCPHCGLRIEGAEIC